MCEPILFVCGRVVYRALSFCLLPGLFLHQVVQRRLAAFLRCCQPGAGALLTPHVVGAERWQADRYVFRAFRVREYPPNALSLCEVGELTGLNDRHSVRVLDVDSSAEHEDPPGATRIMPSAQLPQDRWGRIEPQDA